MHHQSLGIFAKEPRPGQVKSRLAAATSPEWAARIADAFLRDTIARLARVEAQRFLVYSPDQSKENFAALAGNQYQLIPQADGDLGRRMEQFIVGQLWSGAQRIVIVGSDSPSLPAEWIEDAFRQLDEVNLVIGPATDGGYYLLGCAGSAPPIFDNIPWGSEKVLSETISRLSDPAWRVALLPPWYDVDSVADLWALKGHIDALRRSGTDPRLPHTEKLLQDFS
ncbi:MAG TPA: TIGR04282 family arsenosugar biosynthesis glycosyltransferase [Gemmataceae bacterium]|nr:TIGR04282 family arsenosugar biosynthesis glycosyltransferase [Gemmataceae bacterium]